MEYKASALYRINNNNNNEIIKKKMRSISLPSTWVKTDLYSRSIFIVFIYLVVSFYIISTRKWHDIAKMLSTRPLNFAQNTNLKRRFSMDTDASAVKLEQKQLPFLLR